jgi:hypothetical protein
MKLSRNKPAVALHDNFAGPVCRCGSRANDCGYLRRHVLGRPANSGTGAAHGGGGESGKHSVAGSAAGVEHGPRGRGGRPFRRVRRSSTDQRTALRHFAQSIRQHSSVVRRACCWWPLPPAQYQLPAPCASNWSERSFMNERGAAGRVDYHTAACASKPTRLTIASSILTRFLCVSCVSCPRSSWGSP